MENAEKQKYFREMKRERCLCLAKEFRYQDTDDLPSERVLPSDPNYHRYKCRTNWWQGLRSMLRSIVKHGLISGEDVRRDVHAFIDYIDHGIDFSKLRTREEIDKANHMLDAVIEAL